MEIYPDKQKLFDLARYKMPFGKYKDRYLVDLPIAYLVWFKQKGFPKGKLGEYLKTTLDIKSNGLEELIRSIREQIPKK